MKINEHDWNITKKSVRRRSRLLVDATGFTMLHPLFFHIPFLPTSYLKKLRQQSVNPPIFTTLARPSFFPLSPFLLFLLGSSKKGFLFFYHILLFPFQRRGCSGFHFISFRSLSALLGFWNNMSNSGSQYVLWGCCLITNKLTQLSLNLQIRV